MKPLALLVAMAVATAPLATQSCPTVDVPKVPCAFKGMTCICNWKFENRPHTSARGYFMTEKFWNEVHKTCWSELIQFMNTEPRPRAKKGERLRMVPDRINTPVLQPALEAAFQQKKLVLFIGMTGG